VKAVALFCGAHGALVAAALLAPGVAYAQDVTVTETAPAAAPTPQGDQAQGEKLESDEKKNNGRILELVWANAEAGFSYINMQQISSSNLGLQNATSAGGMFGFGAGIRLWILTIGARARLNDLSSFTFWELNGELGFHIPIKKWDPYFALTGGYAFSGSLSSVAENASASESPSDVSIHGADAGLSLGVDYYFLPILSLGLDVTGEALFLSRPPASLPAGLNQLPAAEQMMIENQPLYKATGDSVGFGISGSLHVGLHI
jgi:hypothetical protein